MSGLYTPELPVEWMLVHLGISMLANMYMHGGVMPLLCCHSTENQGLMCRSHPSGGEKLT